MSLRDTVRHGLLLYKMFGGYEMTDLEISKLLALAIGWPENEIEVSNYDVKCTIYGSWCVRTFDYKDWNVIGPIAERYDCFPEYLKHVGGSAKWCAKPKICAGMDWMADTPQKAIAIAVIAAQGETK